MGNALLTMVTLVVMLGGMVVLGGGVWYIAQNVGPLGGGPSAATMPTKEEQDGRSMAAWLKSLNFGPYTTMMPGLRGQPLGCEGHPDLMPSSDPNVGPKWCIVESIKKGIQVCKSMPECRGLSLNFMQKWQDDYPNGVQLVGDGALVPDKEFFTWTQ